MNLPKTLLQRYATGEARAIYELVVSRCFGLSRTDILLGKDTTLSAKDKAELQIIIDRVAKGEPVQYVLGSEEFCGHEFRVTPAVLIPRPETQLLVQFVGQNVPLGGRILDIGTGSGCIAVTLALAGYRVTATDISEDALACARGNAERLGAEVTFLGQDILSSLPPRAGEEGFRTTSGGMDAIVSNPPYICEGEAREVDDNVLRYEPHLALFVPDDDPLLFYRAIADYGLQHLAAGGWLFLEGSSKRIGQVGELLSEKGYTEVNTRIDWYDNERFVCARKRK